jgi:hypothetical protein
MGTQLGEGDKMHRKSLFLIMDSLRNDDRKKERAKNWENRAPSTRIRWLIILGVLLLAAAIFGGVITS